MLQTDTAEFVRRFADAWSAPTVAGLVALTHPDATFVQPLFTVARGHDRLSNVLDELLQTIPDLRGEVLNWAAAGDDTVFVELRLSGTFGRRPIEWITVDKIVLRDGLVAERTANFDGLRLLGALARRPRGWPVWLKAKLDR
ncbi:nuclear transport factor 2 family protein [Actinophytocola gossypii]|uniref:Nuclear transport factor 2 family protein n=1 Tax=Actinophytocola gossypii TaxID=2812003 RepID=A0ABT2J986_9PSEU|nr:nuclear transport factor 2 family protein [Actinophytocola gossypii]MCT2583824.1 nuclear transport factor 2 family protein [Actinophytocola gossypii]